MATRFNCLNLLFEPIDFVVEENTLILNLSSQMVYNAIFNVLHLFVNFANKVIQIIRVNNIVLSLFKSAETTLELVLLFETTQTMLCAGNL